MGSISFLRPLSHATPTACIAHLPSPLSKTHTFALSVSYVQHARFVSLPRIIQPSFWASIVPKPLKERTQLRSKERNPATIYIVLGLLVGSQAIQTLWLKQEKGHSLRKAEAKIGILEEVIRRVQNGENVPVEALLGTGDPEKEQEWEEVIQHLKNEQPLFQSKKWRRALREDASPEGDDEKSQNKAEASKPESEQTQIKVQSFGEAKFY